MAKELDWGNNDKAAPAADWGNSDKSAAQRDLPAGVKPSTAGGGRGSANPNDARLAQANTETVGLEASNPMGDGASEIMNSAGTARKSVLDGVQLPDPQLDPELNRQAMLRSTSPDSVMFNAGRTKQKVDQAVERGKKLEEVAAKNGFDTVPDMLDAQAKSESRQKFAENNPNISAMASGAANMLRGSINAPGAMAGFVNKTVADPVLRLAGFDPMPKVPTAPGTETLGRMAGDFMPEVGKLPMGKAWDNGLFGEWLAANVSAQVPQIAGSVAAVVNPAVRAAVLPGMGAQSAGSSFAEGDDPRVAVSKGILEVLSEGASFGVADKIKDVILKLPQGAQQSLFTNIATRALATGGAITGQMLAGSIEETVAQLGNNALDIYASGQNKALTDKVDEAAVIGGVTSAAMGLPNAATAMRDNSPQAQAAREISRQLNSLEFAPAPPIYQSNPNLRSQVVSQQRAREQRIQTLRDAGETAAADLLQAKHDKLMTAENVESEISSMPGSPEFSDQYRDLRLNGLKPAEAAAQSAVTVTFRGLAQTLGLSDKATNAALDKAKDLPLDKVPDFLQKFTARLSPVQVGIEAVGPTLEAARDDAIDAAMGAIYDPVKQRMNEALSLESETNQQQTNTQPAQSAINTIADVNPLPSVATNNSEQSTAQPVAESQAPEKSATSPRESGDGGVAPTQDAGAPIYFGRDNIPLSEGGKAFKTKQAASDAKRNNPGLRVVRAEGGFALTEKTPAQLASEAANARRLSAPRTSPKGEPIPAHAMIAAAGGLMSSEKSDMNIEGNIRVGNRTLFAGTGRGLSMERATELLIQDGYLLPGQDMNDARNLIVKSLSTPQYTPDGWERIAQAEIEQRQQDRQDEQPAYEDAVAEFEGLSDSQIEEIDDSDIPWDTPSNTDTEATMQALGFDEKDIQDAITEGSRITGPDSQGSGQTDEGSTRQETTDFGQRESAPGEDTRSRSDPRREEAQVEPPVATQEAPSTEGVSASGDDTQTKFTTERRADGTLAVKGDKDAIREALKDIPAASLQPMTGGILVGRSQADRALSLLEPGEPTETARQELVKEKTVFQGEKLGDFYEITGENAKEAAKILNLTLTKNREGVPMVGWPYHMHEQVLKDLEKAGIKFQNTTTAPASKTPTVDAHEKIMANARDGSTTPEEFKASFETVASGKATILAELMTKTKDEMLRTGGAWFMSRYKSENKAEVADALYRDMLGEYSLGESLTYGMGKGAFEAAVRRKVEATDAEKLEKFAKDIQTAIEEAKASRAARAAALENPKTLDDYRNLLNTHIREGSTRKEAFLKLTPEQRITYDALEAESTREAREARKRAAKTEVRAAGQTTGGEIIATKHTRDGYDLFVVQLSDRVSKDDYQTLLSGAKRLGGWYSSYRGGGATPGFQFKDRAQAEAFRSLAGGDTAPAQEQAESRRDAFEDDRSQTAVERLTAMAEKLEGQAEESLRTERKANTARRAQFAASAEAAARQQQALAKTMRNISEAIGDGKAKFLDAVRQKTQVEMLSNAVRTAKDIELRTKYDSYAEQEKRRGQPATAETADHAEFPSFTVFRSDLATLARQMLEVDGTKKLGGQLMKVADDVTSAYLDFAKANILQVSRFGTKAGTMAEFPSREQAERAIRNSRLVGKAIVLPVKRGENRIILSPSEAINLGIWKGDGDKRITLTRDFGNELVQAIGRRGNKSNGLSVPWQFENASDRLKSLSRIGIETPAEFRSALREFIGLQEQAVEADRIKMLERAMIGRKNDGMDFFPTPQAVADQMVDAADIKPDMAVLEPSAGMGHIADRIREAGAEPDVGEMSQERRELLEAKGFNVVGRDFMEMTPRGYTYGDVFKHSDGRLGILGNNGGLGSNRYKFIPVDGDGRNFDFVDREDLTGVEKRGSYSGYDRILMNPPFSDRRDAQHVQHAYTLLKPGGRLVAIMGEGVFFGQDKKAQDFRDWLEKVGGTDEKLPDGTFLDPTLPVNTAANARMVVIDKSENANDSTSEQDAGTAFARGGAASQTNTPEFKRWFGDSKVVDAQGEPLVVYHGAPDARFLKEDGIFKNINERYGGSGGSRAFWFASSMQTAKSYADDRRAFDYQNAEPGIISAYLSLKNPLIVNADGKEWREAQARGKTTDVIKIAQANGHDGVIIRNVRDDYNNGLRTKTTDTYVVFSSNQIKSAISNSGEFDPNNPDIRFARGRSTEPFYSALSKGIEGLNYKQLPPFGWADAIKSLVNKGLVKQDEIEWSGITDWLAMQTGKVTKEQVIEYLDANGVQVTETTLGTTEDAAMQLNRALEGTGYTAETDSIDNELIYLDQNEEMVDYTDLPPEVQRIVDGQSGKVQGSTKYSQYQLPGGESYRELLLTLPENGRADVEALHDATDREYRRFGNSEKYTDLRKQLIAAQNKLKTSSYKSSHWDQPNVLAHIRLNDRTDSTGARVLFVEELQSDWNADGKKRGFVDEASRKQIEKEIRALGIKTPMESVTYGQLGEVGASADLKQRFDAEYLRGASRIPLAPFVTNTDKWLNLALKRIVKMAVDEGYDKVAFVNGQQSADRYWSEPVIVGAVGRWNEVTKPEGIGELSKNILGRKMAALMSLNHVDAGMLPMLKNDQVLKDVVSRVPVNVVNMLSNHNVSAEQLLRDGDMVLDRLPVDDRSRAATAIGSAIGESSTAIRAKLRGLSSGGSDIKIFPALSASDLSPRDVAGILDPFRLFHSDSSDQAKRATSAGTIAEPASSVKGGRVEVQGGTAELTGFLNAHAEIIHGREGLLQQGFEAPPSEGMKAFYDQIVPTATKALLKKLGGGQVVPMKLASTLTNGARPESVVRADTKQEAYKLKLADGKFRGIFESREEANEELLRQQNLYDAPGQNSFDITPAMREKAAGGLPMFAKNPIGTSKGLPLSEVQAIVNQVSKKWGSGPALKVVATPADLPIPAPDDAYGLIHKGTAYVVSGNMRNRSDVHKTLAHEAIGHYGLWKLLGAEKTRRFERSLQLALKSGNKPLKEISKKVRSRYVDEDGNFNLTPAQEANEIAAFAVENALDADGNFKPGYGFFKQLWADIAQFLRDIGIDISFTNVELQGLLISSMKGLEAGQRLGGGNEMVVAAGRGAEIGSEADDLFAHPKSASTTVEGIARDNKVGGEIKAVNMPGRIQYNISLPNNSIARIVVRQVNPYGESLYGYDLDENGKMQGEVIGRPGENAESVPQKDDVWVDVSLLKPGTDGSKIYNVASTYAHNTGKMFIGDPAGLSDEALRRRTEQMISSALKFGTTEHLAPHPRQVSGDSALGVPPLRWVYGDDNGNFERMVDVSIKSMENAFPNSKLVGYNPKNGTFYRTDTGQVFTRQDMAGYGLDIAGKRSIPGSEVEKGQAGWRSVARVALLRALRAADSGTPEQNRRGLLERASSDVSRLRVDPVTGNAYSPESRIFYNRSRLDAIDTPDLLTTYTPDEALQKQEAEETARKAEAEKPQAPKGRKVTVDQVDLFYPQQDSLFARGTPQTGMFAPNIWSMPEPTKLDRALYEIQDGRVDLKRAQQAIESGGKKIAEKWDARLAETLYPGRVAYRSQQFLTSEVQPLLKALSVYKVPMEELADYLHARGAKERNVQVAKVNPDMPDGGAGRNTKGELMTNDAAQAYLDSISPTRKKLLDVLAAKVDRITAGTRKLLVSEGLEKQETIDAWTGVYKNYVPMFRDEAEAGIPHPQGTGFNVRGSASKRAMGSTKEVTNIIAHVLMQREAAITRSEKNLVALSLYGMALSHPNPDFWSVIKPSMSNSQIAEELSRMGVDHESAAAGMALTPSITTVDPNTNKVVSRPNPLYKNLPGAITLRINGEDRVLMLNTETERGMRLAGSLKNLDGLTAIDWSTGLLHKYVWSKIPPSVAIAPATRWIAAVNTQYNPAWGLFNLTRDTLGGAVNLGSTELRGNSLTVLAKTPAAILGIARELASPNQNGKWQTLYRQYQADGGQTGFKEQFRDPNERAKAIEKELATMDRAKWNPAYWANLMLDLLAGFNTTLENAVRLSAYEQSLKKGMSGAKSAQLARELTVDFNRKGRVGREAGTLYAFFNASVQGTERTIQTLKGPTGAKVIAGGIGLGVIQALMLAAAGYDDDEIPEFVKTRSLIIPLFDEEKNFISVPYPLGLHVLPNTGRVMTELVLNGGKDIGKRSAAAVGEIASAFNPLGGGNIFTADGALKTVAPTLIDPVIELGFNKDFTGRPIERQAFGDQADARPGFAKAKEATIRSTTGQAYIGISKAINTMTGGNDYEAGAASPTPERIRYLAQVAGGGVLREIEKTINASTAEQFGKKVAASQIPVAGKFFGEVDQDQVKTSRYYENSKKINSIESLSSAIRKAGDLPAMQALSEEHPEVRIVDLANKVQSSVSELNKQAVKTVGDTQQVKNIDEARVQVMDVLNQSIEALEKETRGETLGDKVKAGGDKVRTMIKEAVTP